MESEDRIRFEVKRQLSAYSNSQEDDPNVGRAYIA